MTPPFSCSDFTVAPESIVDVELRSAGLPTSELYSSIEDVPYIDNRHLLCGYCDSPLRTRTLRGESHVLVCQCPEDSPVEAP